MFKALKDGKIIAINETGVFPCLVHDSVEEDIGHTVNDFVQVNGEFVLTSSDEAIEQRKEQVRFIRNQYLSDTDKYMIADYPITEEEREQYKAYRVYLRDYTLEDEWLLANPKTFEDWSEQLVLEKAE